MTYLFDTQFARGKSGEQALDAYFSRHWDIRAATREQERQGIDRIFRRHDGAELSVQYKTDFKAGRTGNVFIETVSGDAIGRAGWAFTCQADRLIIYIPDWSRAYVLTPALVASHVHEWKNRYRIRVSENDGYHTYGVLVPVSEIEQLATQILSI